MSRTTQIIWFEIHVLDMQRAISFYEMVFDIEIKWMQFGDIEMGWFPPSPMKGAATGTLIKQESYQPNKTGTLLYFQTDDITTELRRVAAAGGTVLIDKRAIGEGQGSMAVFLDSEGNRVALHCN